jgi:DNA-binding NarL/FixJ family response regulator
MYQAFDNDTVLRIVPLGAKLFGCVAIFIDAFSRRGSVFEAAKLYGLTKRESEVLQLLIRGNTNPEIANELCVAESTAGDHIKSLMRKTKSTKRVQLLIVSRGVVYE